MILLRNITILFIFSLLFAAFAQRPAFAQKASSEEEAALLLFDEGKKEFASKNYNQALYYFKRAYNVVQNVFIEYNLALAYQNTEQYEDALKFWEKLDGKLSGNEKKEQENGLIICHFGIAGKLEEEKKFSESLMHLKWLEGKIKDPDLEKKCIEAIERIKPNVSDFPIDTPTKKAAYLIYEEGKKLFSSGSIDRALAKFEAAAKIYKEPNISFYRGLCFLEKADCEHARKELGDLAEKLPDKKNRIEEAVNLCGVYEQNLKEIKKPDDRIRLFRLYRMAELEYKNKNYEKAGSLLEESLGILENTQIRYRTGLILLEKKEYLKAKSHFDKIKKYNPPAGESPSFYAAFCSFAMVDSNDNPDKAEIFRMYMNAEKMFAENKISDAENLLRKIMKNPFSHELLGRIYIASNRCSLALKEFNDVVAVVPERKNELVPLSDLCRIKIEQEEVSMKIADYNRKKSLYSLWGWICGGTGIVSAAAAGYFGMKYYSSKNDFNNAVKAYNNAVTESDAQNARKKIDSARKSEFFNSTAGLILGGVGAVSVAAGLYLLLSPPDPPDASVHGQGATVHLMPVFEGIGLSVGLY
jgi:tetratricopeptide (TPR) repeat protein